LTKKKAYYAQPPGLKAGLCADIAGKAEKIARIVLGSLKRIGFRACLPVCKMRIRAESRQNRILKWPWKRLLMRNAQMY